MRWAVDQRGRLDLAALEAIWPIAVGRVWARRTRPKRLRGRRLEVGVPDGVWLAELRYQREQVLDRLNGLLPPGVGPIESLRLSVGGAPPFVGREPSSGGGRELAEVPMTAEQESALESIQDDALRQAVARVIERDAGRLSKGAAGQREES